LQATNCPGFARPSPKIPCFCPVVVTPGGLCSPRDGPIGEIITMIKASGRAALILAAGLFVALGGVSQAAPTASSDTTSDSASKSSETVKETKPRRHHARHHTSKTAADDKAGKADKKDVAAAESTAPASSAMPPSVANANAQLAAADTPTATAAAATAMTS